MLGFLKWWNIWECKECRQFGSTRPEQDKSCLPSVYLLNHKGGSNRKWGSIYLKKSTRKRLTPPLIINQAHLAQINCNSNSRTEWGGQGAALKSVIWFQTGFANEISPQAKPYALLIPMESNILWEELWGKVKWVRQNTHDWQPLCYEPLEKLDLAPVDVETARQFM